MGGVNVKNTMIQRVLQIIAPHPCFGCGKIGIVLCDDCKYDIINEPFAGCILCGSVQSNGICQSHGATFNRAFTIGTRQDALEDCINRLKFHNVKEAAKELAVLMDWSLPVLPSNTVIVPLPTARSHVRQRGYDQVEIIARHFASLRDLPVKKLLKRRTNTTQHTVGRDERQKQAAEAFSMDTTQPVQEGLVLLIDDIVTTGASVQAASRHLAMAGYPVWVATLAYQPLD